MALIYLPVGLVWSRFHLWSAVCSELLPGFSSSCFPPSPLVGLPFLIINETPACVCCRTYALRRVRDAFRANREVEDPKAVERLMEEGEQMLALIQRQV